MATLPQIRGLILEEVVLHLLSRIGYRIVNPGEEGTRNGHAGLEIQGRGDWHQVDAFAALEYIPPFMYPLRLVLEAKCYERGRPVGIEVARNLLGVVTDVSQNYFSYAPGGRDSEVQMQRFNYHVAIFSTSGYTRSTQRYSLAHQIFLIQYQRVPVMEPIIRRVLDLNTQHFHIPRQGRETEGINIRLSAFRKKLREYFGKSASNFFWTDFLTVEGQRLIGEIEMYIGKIGGSYYGMIQGVYPLHLLSERPLPPELFRETDEILCKIWVSPDRWSFVPSEIVEDDERFFLLEFDIPDEIAKAIKKRGDDWRALARVKQERVSYLDLVGSIGGVRRFVRLKLDRDWLAEYIQRRERKER